ncbi:FKBP-type peptidyl-prolyl cis-trans isomerase [Mangrovibacterium lignilyticum]|uniref:FKBP-type peptidyl-prolyl cis-trans isomerase n=1 Tax=Mangrovibacterium lignilyticum TaxID=2668052 RepID=UPI0013D6B937|nr:FKBP-type peptidyl-prolyl cis-trans isomerase [Mangrovibacterium lignilyticum]
MNIKPVLVAVAAVTVFAACQPSGRSTAKLTNATDSTSYALGVLIGDNQKQNIDQTPGAKDLNMDILVAAFEKQIKGEEPSISSEDARKIVQEYFQGMAAREADENTKKGEEFLAANKEKSGVVTTESGLQYEILTEGTGPKPTADQKVKCHYTGTLLDGKVFDSSVERGEPAEFPVSGVIPGWVEALQLMPVGSKWKLYIPGQLAYGQRGAGADIGPNETLIFEVELLEIVD